MKHKIGGKYYVAVAGRKRAFLSSLHGNNSIQSYYMYIVDW